MRWPISAYDNCVPPETGAHEGTLSSQVDNKQKIYSYSYLIPVANSIEHLLYRSEVVLDQCTSISVHAVARLGQILSHKIL
jgi:hypothetical protein